MFVRKYDDIDWHTGGDFPADLNASHARTHIALFLEWAIRRGHESDTLRSLHPDALHSIRQGQLSGKDLLAQCCDDKLTSDDLSETGNGFAQAYYEVSYLEDYVDLSDDDLPTLYHEPYDQKKHETYAKGSMRDFTNGRNNSTMNDVSLDVVALTLVPPLCQRGIPPLFRARVASRDQPDYG